MNRETVQPWSGDEPHVRASFRSTWLCWTDPHSGERLTVRMNGDTDYVSELVSEGFELLAGPDAEVETGAELDGPADCKQSAPAPRAPAVRRFASVAVDAPHGRSGNRRAG